MKRSPLMFMVGQGRIELPTPGFSVQCSTDWATDPWYWCGNLVYTILDSTGAFIFNAFLGVCILFVPIIKHPWEWLLILEAVCKHLNFIRNAIEVVFIAIEVVCNAFEVVYIALELVRNAFEVVKIAVELVRNAFEVVRKLYEVVNQLVEYLQRPC